VTKLEIFRVYPISYVLVSTTQYTTPLLECARVSVEITCLSEKFAMMLMSTTPMDVSIIAQ
jgi:hypothetical protein